MEGTALVEVDKRKDAGRLVAWGHHPSDPQTGNRCAAAAIGDRYLESNKGDGR